MPADSTPGGNRVQPSAFPHLQNKDKVVVGNVSTTRSGQVAGQRKDSVKS